ncbi:MAG: glycoside hydrolase family 5 protein [Treponema sp.]|jgi:endoglucanase|nr:glycoside hydrolase family 5 protein [Treponema sp.]
MKKKLFSKTMLIFVVFALVFAFAFAGFSSCNPDTGNGIEKDDLDDDVDYPDYDNVTIKPFTETTATALVNKMTVGWNLGNTLDAGYPTWLSNPTLTQIETAWVSHKTNKANIDALKTAGFNAIRIPVSWHKCVDNEYKIRKDWMDRVTEIVGYAVSNDMYIILNTHHDEDIFKFMDKDMAKSLPAFKRIWKQIALAFRGHDEKLIFEALNEPRTKGSSNEWGGGTPEEHKNLNKYYQAFVDTVRATGDNNKKRILMVNTYAASADDAAIKGLTIPTDSAKNCIIVSIHSYSPYNFALNTNAAYNTWNESGSNKTDITSGIDRAHTAFTSGKGIPVIIGEFGAMNKNNDDARALWAEFYVKHAKTKGMPCFWWDNAHFTGDGEKFGLLNRTNNSFTYPKIVEGLMDGLK